MDDAVKVKLETLINLHALISDLAEALGGERLRQTARDLEDTIEVFYSCEQNEGGNNGA